jgi:hypothetical protein
MRNQHLREIVSVFSNQRLQMHARRASLRDAYAEFPHHCPIKPVHRF